MKLGEPLAERKKIISKLLKSAESTYSLNFRFQQFELPVIGLPIEFPKYRIENGREYWDIKETTWSSSKEGSKPFSFKISWLFFGCSKKSKA